MQSVEPLLPPGPFADRYVIERELGQGATSIVYLARDTQYDRLVAIKTLKRELAESVSAERFLREIRVTGQLTHPNILPLLDSGARDGRLYCVLPYMKGGTLRARLERDKQFPLEDAVSIGVTLARALDSAHANNVVHRDVKPENILFTDNEPSLADFGIAKAIESAGGDTMTSTGIVRGTPAYMSPEQATGVDTYDGRSDIYSLGCVLYEMIAGVPAYIGATPQSVVAQRLVHAPRPLSVYRPLTPPALESVILKAMAMLPADRFQTAGAFADALQSADLTPPIPVNAGRRLAAVIAASVVTIGLVGWWAIFGLPGISSPGKRLEAEEAYVTGNMHAARFRSPDRMREAIASYKEATRLDPKFALAFARLAQVQSVYYADVDRTAERQREAKAALDRALALDVQHPETRVALGFYKYWVEGKRDSAMVHLAAAHAVEPDNAELLSAMGTMFRSQGRHSDALQVSRKALSMDSRSPRYAFDVATTASWMGKFAEADSAFAQAIALAPDNLPPYLTRASLQMSWRGDLRGTHRVLDDALEQPGIDTTMIIKALIPRFRQFIAMLDKPWQDAVGRVTLSSSGLDSAAYYLAQAERLRRLGAARPMVAYADSARRIIEKRVRADTGNAGMHSELAYAYAYAGRTADATREAERALALTPMDHDVIRHAFQAADYVRLQTLIGHYDAAVARLRLSKPVIEHLISKAYLTHHPEFAPLRTRPDFQALMREYP